MRRPNVLLILNDDMGYSDLGCYGGEIDTPNLDWLAMNGLRYTQFYNTARCCPSRASLLTGAYPHQADVGDMVGDDDMDGYLGDLSMNCATLAEVLSHNGYKTYMSGKWHVTGHYDSQHNWPCQRGFDRYYGMLCGAASYFAPKTLKVDNTSIEAPEGDFYFTDAISEAAIGHIEDHLRHHEGTPFFQYVAYTAPHWPLHARPEDIAKYAGKYDCGWDALREQRLQRMRDLGILGEEAALSERDPSQPAWEASECKSWQARRMEVYAAQIDRMDQGIGRILKALAAQGQLENTLIMFLADNGGCHEEIAGHWAEKLGGSLSAQAYTRDGKAVRFGNSPNIIPGAEDTYCSYGIPWANVSNTPFRKYKSWVHEGGISTPFILHWQAGISRKGEIRTQPAQLPDVMATILECTGARYPESINHRSIQPHEGFSMVPSFVNEPHSREILFWEHEGNAAIRRGKWKLVREYVTHWIKDEHLRPGQTRGLQPWELYDIEADRSELNNLADREPGIVAELEMLWHSWAKRCNVRPWDEVLAKRAEKST
ncbi:MAG: arylsulfatase [Verrucomicrobia bacterium]|nr:arylsulfatase [Verrucomicrobiota bacterium]